MKPKHTRETFETYGFGLGCNTIEGREQKHQMVENYHSHLHYHDRWLSAFRQEFIHLIRLRENGYDSCGTRRRVLTMFCLQLTEAAPKAVWHWILSGDLDPSVY